MKHSIINKIVLNIPHSSNLFPFGKGAWSPSIENSIEEWTDTCAEYIFGTAALLDQRVVPIIFPWSRFFCDVEGIEDDKHKKEDQRIVYTQFEGNNRIISKDERDKIMRYYYDYREMLCSHLTPETLLVDCHSFPQHVAPEVDICIGYNFNWSHPGDDLLKAINDFFRMKGYSVYYNKPYSNSITPDREMKYKSVKIAVNKGLYLNSSGKVLTDNIEVLRSQMEELFISILNDHKNLYGTFIKEFPVLWKNRDVVLSKQSYYASDIGLQVYGVGKVTLGMLFKAMVDNRELFTAKYRFCCGAEMLITGFSGSPLSGICCADALCPICGSRRSINTGGFGARAKALGAVKRNESIYSVTGIPVAVLPTILSSKSQ